MPQIRLAIFGAQGQLGIALIEAATVRGIDAIGFGRTLDITDGDAVHAAIASRPVDVIINAAAYSEVDRAEQDQEAAYGVNRDGARHIALAAQTTGAALIHLSTDYVFDGAKHEGYVEDDATAPLGVYGASKAAGEIAVRETCRRSAVVRTSWLYGGAGANFVNTVIGLAAKRNAVRMVDDRRGSPTPVDQLANGLLDMASAMKTDTLPYGIYHLASPDGCSRFDLAQAIFDGLAQAGRTTPAIHKVKTAERAEVARRPENSALCCDKIERVLNLRLPPWRQSLQRFLSQRLSS